MIVIRGAKVYDPAHGIDGEVRDLWVDGERIVPAPGGPVAYEVVDGRGMVVAPAGVEIHAHVAGYALNAARRFLLGDPAISSLLTPSAGDAAERYLCLGYTTVFDAAASPLFSRASYYDLQHMPDLDRGMYTLLGDHLLLLKALAGGDKAMVRDTLAWLLRASAGYAVKLVNPGGGYAWKAGQHALDLDEPIGLGNLTQRKIIQMVAQAVNEMGLPHAIHLHAGRLGQPGNFSSFLETIRALEGRRAHLCHIQFYSYGEDDHGGYTSAAEQVVKGVEAFPEITLDVGQVLFGPALAVTADTSGLDYLRSLTRQPWISRQVEGEGGANVMPLSYLARDPAGAVQWATGLELMLRFPDPARMFLTTDHPNGGPFTAYPQIIEWLMSKPARDKALSQVHQAARAKTGLASVEREYTLAEIVSMTSWGPARALGLSDRGHLGVGALADIRCYTPQADVRAMFACPAWVMRRGGIVVREGLKVGEGRGNILVVRPTWDEGRREWIHQSLADMLTVRPENYGMGTSGLEETREVPCKSTAS